MNRAGLRTAEKRPGGVETQAALLGIGMNDSDKGASSERPWRAWDYGWVALARGHDRTITSLRDRVRAWAEGRATVAYGEVADSAVRGGGVTAPRQRY